MKIVLNKCFGGFALSEAAFAELGIPWDGYGYTELARNDPRLVAAVEKLGEAASGQLAKLSIVEIPDSVDYEIDDYDGIETVHQRHRTWG